MVWRWTQFVEQFMRSDQSGNMAVLTLCVLFAVLQHISGGIPVAKFQEDGFYSNKSYLRHKSGLRRALKDFTLCTWLNINYLRGDTNYWFSMGNRTNTELMSGGKCDCVSRI